MTLLAGREDPLVENEHLYAVGDAGDVVLATFRDAAAARCTLLSPDGQTAEIEETIRRFATEGGLEIAAIEAWTSAEPVGFQAKAARVRAEKLGAHVRSLADVQVDLALLARPTFAWPPVGVAPIARRVFVLAKGGFDASWLDAIPSFDAARWALAGPAPSAAFVRAVVARDAAVVYEVRDHLGRSAAVLVGARARVVGVADQEGIARRYEGDRAGLVLAVGPSGAPP
jgi:hypothetical protein